MQHVLNFVARNVGTKIKYANVLKDVHSATIRQDIEPTSAGTALGKPEPGIDVLVTRGPLFECGS
jgi:hypothetical protein